MSKCTIKWHKFNDSAIVPTKTPDNAGFDVYTIEDEVMLRPHTQYLFATGIGYIIDSNHWLKAEDRGSTGSKGIHIHCGICDTNYRGEVFICLNNDNDYPILFSSTKTPGPHYHKERVDAIPPSEDGMCNTVLQTKEEDILDYVVYPTTKGIAQLIPVEKPEVEATECTQEEWELSFAQSDRKDGKLGSSGK